MISFSLGLTGLSGPAPLQLARPQSLPRRPHRRSHRPFGAGPIATRRPGRVRRRPCRQSHRPFGAGPIATPRAYPKRADRPHRSHRPFGAGPLQLRHARLRQDLRSASHRPFGGRPHCNIRAAYPRGQARPRGLTGPSGPAPLQRSGFVAASPTVKPGRTGPSPRSSGQRYRTIIGAASAGRVTGTAPLVSPRARGGLARFFWA